MKSAFLAIALHGLLANAPAQAASPFDGDWIADLDRQSGLATDSYLVRDGQYACDSCAPQRSHPADGKMHPVAGDPDVATESVTVTGPRSIVTHIIGPPLDRLTTMTVAADDQTATYVAIDHRPGVSIPLRTEYLARRLAPAPPGAHPVSGKWQGVEYIEVPEIVRTTQLRLEGDQFSRSNLLGTSYTARLGGDYVPLRSTHGGNVTIAVRRTGQRQIEERAQRDGQLLVVRTFTVARDGRSMETATTDPIQGTTFRSTSHRAGKRHK
ncbi:hypothetical protein [Sandarakinorhabdus sp. DWP1-3-1]|uniref:hypothetical protein n=1 Tax=Sandarakinorhabdus sp. DWP1-3-1 TaxID=2804627 RepID=UPI003CF4F498